MYAESLYFIYVTRNDELLTKQKEDWQYVSLMSRFFQKWIKRSFNVRLSVSADILPVIPGRVFDRMSISYLARDHSERGKSVYHFYLAYFKPFWTDCQTEGYSSDNLGIVFWSRPKEKISNAERIKYFADKNCVKISHLITHEVLRMAGNSRKIYFDAVHKLFQKHIDGKYPVLHFNEHFDPVAITETYHFATIDVKKITPP